MRTTNVSAPWTAAGSRLLAGWLLLSACGASAATGSTTYSRAAFATAENKRTPSTVLVTDLGVYELDEAKKSIRVWQKDPFGVECEGSRFNGQDASRNGEQFLNPVAMAVHPSESVVAVLDATSYAPGLGQVPQIEFYSWTETAGADGRLEKADFTFLGNFVDERFEKASSIAFLPDGKLVVSVNRETAAMGRGSLIYFSGYENPAELGSALTDGYPVAAIGADTDADGIWVCVGESNAVYHYTPLSGGVVDFATSAVYGSPDELLDAVRGEDKWPLVFTGRFAGESTVADEDGLLESTRREILALLKAGISAEATSATAAFRLYSFFYELYARSSVHRVALLPPDMIAMMEDEEQAENLQKNLALVPSAFSYLPAAELISMFGSFPAAFQLNFSVQIDALLAHDVVLGTDQQAGDTLGFLSAPRAVRVWTPGTGGGPTVLVADTGNNRICAFAPDGTPLYQFGSFSSDEFGKFKLPRGIWAEDGGLALCVGDTGNRRVQLLDIDADSLDSDGDGLTDGDERDTYGTDPFDADTDDDGLKDGREISLGTKPLDADTDGDGYVDGEEVDELGTDPLDPDDPPDGMIIILTDPATYDESDTATNAVTFRVLGKNSTHSLSISGWPADGSATGDTALSGLDDAASTFSFQALDGNAATENGVTLTLESETGYTATWTFKIRNVAPAIVSASAAPNPAKAGQPIRFSVDTTDVAADELTYQWKVNGYPFLLTDEETGETHPFDHRTDVAHNDAPGTYYFTVVVSDPQGAKDSITFILTLEEGATDIQAVFTDVSGTNVEASVTGPAEAGTELMLQFATSLGGAWTDLLALPYGDAVANAPIDPAVSSSVTLKTGETGVLWTGAPDGESAVFRLIYDEKPADDVRFYQIVLPGDND